MANSVTSVRKSYTRYDFGLNTVWGPRAGIIQKKTIKKKDLLSEFSVCARGFFASGHPGSCVHRTCGAVFPKEPCGWPALVSHGLWCRGFVRFVSSIAVLLPL